MKFYNNLSIWNFEFWSIMKHKFQNQYKQNIKKQHLTFYKKVFIGTQLISFLDSQLTKKLINRRIHHQFLDGTSHPMNIRIDSWYELDVHETLLDAHPIITTSKHRKLFRHPELIEDKYHPMFFLCLKFHWFECPCIYLISKYNQFICGNLQYIVTL